MTETDTGMITAEEVFPHAPAILWQAISDGAVMARWMMPPTGFLPVVGQDFSFQTRGAGAWDGTIHCRVTEVVPGEKLAFTWVGGSDDNVGYGSRLNTVVTFTLTEVVGGTRLRLTHAGFQMPRNEVAYQNMGTGWNTVLGRIGMVLPGVPNS
jgi:uncharacterized protein YndB with AHSA1/START domain